MQDDIYGAIIYGASHMRELTLGPLNESRSAPRCCQLIGQAATWPLSLPVTVRCCDRTFARRHLPPIDKQELLKMELNTLGIVKMLHDCVLQIHHSHQHAKERSLVWWKPQIDRFGRQLMGQATSWPLSPPVGCYRPNIHPSPFVLLLNSFTVPRRVEGWVDLDTTVSVSLCQKLYIIVIFVKNTNFCLQRGLILGPLVLQASMLLLDHCDLTMICKWEDEEQAAIQ